MDLKTLRETHPELAQALIDEGHAAGLITGRTEGATAERQRIQDVEAQAMPGQEDLVKTLKFDGKTTGPEAAVKVLAAEKAKGGARLDELRADAPKPAPAAASDTGEHAAANADDQNLTIEERAKKKFEADPKIREEFETVERYTGWLKHEASRKAA